MPSNNPVAMIFEFIFSPIGIFLIAVIIGAYLFYVYVIKRKQPEEDFESKPFHELVLEDLDDLFKIQGIDTKGSLVQGFDFIGDVDKWLRVTKSDKSQFAIDENERRIVEITNPKEPEKYNLYIFRIYTYNFFLMNWLGFGKRYAVINKKSIVNINTISKKKTWNISVDTQLERYANVFITSQEGVDYVNDIAIKKMNEALLTYIANAPDRLIYLEMKHAKAIDRLRQAQEIKTKSFREYKKAEAEDEEKEDED